MTNKALNKPKITSAEKAIGRPMLNRNQLSVKDLLNFDVFEVLPLLLFLLVAFIVFAVFADGFLTVDNLLNVLRQIAYSTILATGLGIVIIGGGIDLSVGGTAALVGIVTAASLQAGINTYVAILIGTTVGIACGLANGLMIALVGIPPFIMTLALGFISQGIIFTWTRGYPIYDGITEEFLFIGLGYVLNIPTPVIIMLVFLAGFYIFMSKTTHGRYIYALGDSEDSLRVCGVNTKRVRLTTYVISGFLAGAAGIVMTSRMQSGQPSIAIGGGLSLLIYSITGVILGGISLSGGKGSLMGIVGGTLFIGMLTNGLAILGFGTFRQMIIIGMALMAALCWNVLRVRK